MKRSFIIAVSLVVMVGLLLTGCTSANKTEGNSDSKAKGADVTTITFWNRLPALNDAFTSIAKDFEKENPKIKIKMQNIAVGSADTQFQAAVSNSKLPDIFVISKYTVPQLASLNQVHSLNDIFPQDVRDQYQDGAFAEGLSSVDGNIYKLPLYSGYHGVYMMYYNKDVLKKLGLDGDIPKTWDDLSIIGKKVYKKSNGQIYGLLIGGKSDYVTSSVISQMASAISPETGMDYKTGQYDYATDGEIETLNYFKQLLKDKVLNPTSLEIDEIKGGSLFSAGQAAFYLNGNWQGSKLGKDFDFDNWGVAPLPTKGGKPQYKEYQGGVAEGIGVSKYTKHWPEDKKFLTYLRDHIDSYVVHGGVTESPKKQQYVEAKPSFTQYKTITNIMDQTNILVPNPYQRNPQTLNVVTEFNNKKPQQTPGKILIGYLTGQVKDAKGTLQKLTDDTNKIFNHAIQADDKVTKKDFIFADWVPGKPFSK